MRRSLVVKSPRAAPPSPLEADLVGPRPQQASRVVTAESAIVTTAQMPPPIAITKINGSSQKNPYGA
jgi:hypothetical protein